VTAHSEEARHPLGPLAPPGGASGLLAVFQRRYLLRLLLRKELQVRYQGSVVGLAWSYVRPLIRFFMYFVVMGIVLGLNRFEDFPVHIFAGMVVLHLFTETFAAGTRSIVRNKSLITKVQLPRETFPVASLLVSMYHVIPQLAVLLAMAVGYGWQWDPLALPAGVLGFTVMAVYAMAVGLMFSALNVFFRDTQNFVETIGILITWSVPMIYPLNRILSATDTGALPEWGVQVYLANPLAESVLLFQRAWWTPCAEDPAEAARIQMPSHLFERGFLALAGGLVLLWVAQKVFTRLEGSFAELL
jgi:ABC-type polysaccharide/polyol phosphate export permease